MRTALLIASLFLALPAQAATFYVTHTGDTGFGSLSSALVQLNARQDTSTVHTIEFTAEFPLGGIITPIAQWPEINRPGDWVIIDGKNRQPVFDGNGADRLLRVNGSVATLHLYNLSLRNARTASAGGGCLRRTSDTGATNLMLDKVAFENCVAQRNGANAAGGAIRWISPGADISIRNAVFRDNFASVLNGSSATLATGGAVHLVGHYVSIRNTGFHDNALGLVGSPAAAMGGAAYLVGYESGSGAVGGGIRLERVQFEGNLIDDVSGVGLIGAGAAALLDCLSGPNCTANVTASSFINNRIIGRLGLGSGLAVMEVSTAVENSSFSGNRAEGGGGGALYMEASPALHARHLAFQNNAGEMGAHLYLYGTPIKRWTWSVMGSLANAGDSACLFEGSTSTEIVADNLYENSCDILSGGQSSQVVASVGPLALDDRNFPAMLAPGEGSPMIDFDGTTAPSATDAWGTVRPLDGDGDGVARPDLGPVEFDLVTLFRNGFESP